TLRCFRMTWVFSFISFLIVLLAMAGQIDFYRKIHNLSVLYYSFYDKDNKHYSGVIYPSSTSPGNGFLFDSLSLVCTFLFCLSFFEFYIRKYNVTKNSIK